SQPPATHTLTYTTLFRSIPNGPGHIPENTKPENFQALIEATIKYGRYYEGSPPEPRTASNNSNTAGLSEPNVITPWEVVKKENRSEEHTSELQSRENLVC